MTVIKSIDCAGTNLDIYDGNIGIMVSGGVDSAILLYYLMKHSNETIHIYTLASNLKYRRNAIIAPRVVEKCIELTGNINVVHHISYFPTLQDLAGPGTLKFKAEWEEETLTRMISIGYGGVTMNPPDAIADSFAPELDRQLSRSDSGDNDLSHNDDKFYTPWANTNKKGIAKMYREENLMDSLFPITRSCEYDPTCEYFDKIKDPQLGHCGECWWCKEREWAFKENRE